MSHKDTLRDFIRDLPQSEQQLLDQMNEVELNPLKQPAGPNTWHLVRDKDSARGRYYDYETLDQGNETVIVPTCEASLQWCYRFLPEDWPRWGACGFKVETKWLKLIMRSMHSDNLIAEEEYAAAMNDQEKRG